MYMTVSMATSTWRPTPLMEPIPEGCQLRKSATFHSFGESQRFCNGGDAGPGGESSGQNDSDETGSCRQEHSTRSFVSWLSRLSLRRRGGSKHQRHQNGFLMKNSVSLCKFGQEDRGFRIF